jgi:hypothetical protein
MAPKISDLSALNLDDVENRMFSKYDISRSDARLAIEYLKCFFDAKKRNPDQLIILPQIADWAWHELILDTERYRTVCCQVLGKFLDHLATNVDPDERLDSPDSDARNVPEVQQARALSNSGFETQDLRKCFLKSLAMMQGVYGLDLGSNPEQWREAGWDSPTYRLRKPIEVPCHSEKARNNACDLGESKKAPFLTWLPSRIARRFGISIKAAEHGVREYSDFFLSSLCPGQKVHEERSVLCEIAWEEHVLWTQRYAEDCYRSLGYFLEHVPRSDFSHAKNSTTYVVD